MPITKNKGVHLGLLDDMDHEAKWDTDAEYRKTELRIQALGAAISRRDWHAVEQAHANIRDKFYSHSVMSEKPSDISDIFGPNVGPPTEKPIKGIDTDSGGF